MPNPTATLHSPRWDPWVLLDQGTYRLFYLGGRTDQDPWWKTSWICGATSTDFSHWQHNGTVIEPHHQSGWESGRLFAGSTYKEEGTYYLFYSAASESDIAKEAIGLATSTDAMHWQRLDRPLLSIEDALKESKNTHQLGYGGRCNWSNHLHWRDPYVIKDVIKDADAHKYYLFFCTSLSGSALYQGGLGVAVADRLSGPYRLLPPAAGPGVKPDKVVESAEMLGPAAVDATEEWPFYHLERPQIIYFQDKYHLFFSCFKAFVNPLWLEKIGEGNVTDSTLYWYVADSAAGPFEPVAPLPIVPGSESTALYGTTFYPLEQGGDWGLIETAGAVEMTVLGWYHDSYTLAVSQEFKAIWDEAGLRIVENEFESDFRK